MLILSPLHDNMHLPDSILKALQGFGLTEPEVSVYFALLEFGSQPASILAKKAHLKRGHTYNMLALVMQKGDVQEFEKDGTKYLTGCSPSVLISIFHGRRGRSSMTGSGNTARGAQRAASGTSAL